MKIRKRVVLLASLLIWGPAACGDALITGTPTSLLIESGNGQAGPANSSLANPLVVVLHDVDGQPIKGETITWTVVSGNGTLNPATSVTDEDGLAETRWTLGPVVGNQTVHAAAPDLPPVTFTATAN